MTGSKTNVDESSLTHQATAEARNSRTRAPTARLLGCCARLLFQAEQEPEQGAPPGAGDASFVAHGLPDGVPEALGALGDETKERRGGIAHGAPRDFGVQIQAGGQAERGELSEAAGAVEGERDFGVELLRAAVARGDSQADIYLVWQQLEERAARARRELWEAHQERMVTLVHNVTVAMAAHQNALAETVAALRQQPHEHRRMAGAWRSLARAYYALQGAILVQDPPRGWLTEWAAAVERRGGWPTGTCARWERGQAARVRRPQEGALRPDLTATVQWDLEVPREPPWVPGWRWRGRRGRERRCKPRASRGRNIYLAELRELGREFASFPYRGD